jgi:uncharacterized protein YegP (UPF0339 family)
VPANFVVYADRGAKYRWKLEAGNGQTIASWSFASKSNTHEAAKSVKARAAEASVKEERAPIARFLPPTGDGAARKPSVARLKDQQCRQMPGAHEPRRARQKPRRIRARNAGARRTRRGATSRSMPRVRAQATMPHDEHRRRARRASRRSTARALRPRRGLSSHRQAPSSSGRPTWIEVRSGGPGVRRRA